ncbi:LacI family DNA-binding transcriptional regulator [Flavisphingomonas formosensis]|uniref:LacI family DNA-binding transcriptional regulator n=1 Tax=Flavisphingomonas formosensis TaxID=861534 RepID=UPI0018E063DE|nr:LacI family DNA-binding transcriptional regulator [Sphingomonas formosensis]
MARATIIDVAKAAGVSIQTVSRVINNGAHVSANTRQKVEAAIAALDFRPSAAARTLRGGRSFQLALLFDNPSAAYFHAVYEGAKQRCTESGFRLITQSCRFSDDALVEDVRSLIAETRVDGIILSPPFTDHDALIDALLQLSLPFSRIAPTTRLDIGYATAIDDVEAAAMATRHLTALGHRRIGFVRGHPDHGASVQRLQGYCDALASERIAFDENLVVEGQFTFASGCEAARQLLARENRPTAIFASNDDMAAGVLAFAHERRIRVPEELSIMGFDDNEVAQMVWPPLTTVHQPMHALAHAAADLLIARPSAGTESNRRLKFELVLRASTAPVRSGPDLG